MDVGDAKDLHPKNKKPIGIRLAKTSLNLTYGKTGVAYEGPRYQYMETLNKKAIIHFNNETIAGGLRTNNKLPPMFFTVAGKDQVFYPADAAIVNNTIVVSSKKVSNIVAVRYAFTNYPVTNLENTEGLPAVPFRTDNWPEHPVK